MPVLEPRFDLTMGRLRVNAVRSIKLTLSRTLPCDQLEVTLPFLDETNLKLFTEDGAGVDGEAGIKLKLGYSEPEPVDVFTGIITEISPEQPFTIKAADAALSLKTTRYVKTYADRNLYGPLGGIEESWHSAIAHHAISQAGLKPVVPIYCDLAQGDFKRKTFVVNNQTCAEVLEKLKEIGWDYFCIPTTNEVYFGPPWPWARGILTQNKIQVFTFGSAFRSSPTPGFAQHLPNIISSSGLKFEGAKKVGTVKVYLVDTEFTRTGKDIVGEFGEGEPVREFSFEGSMDGDAQENANARAKQIWIKLKSSFFTGSFKTFGSPKVRHSMAIKLNDPAHGERSDEFWVNQVEHVYGPESGFCTTITLCEQEGSI